MSDNNSVRTTILDFCLSDICHDETVEEVEKLFSLFIIAKINDIFQTEFSQVANLKHQKVETAFYSSADNCVSVCIKIVHTKQTWILLTIESVSIPDETNLDLQQLYDVAKKELQNMGVKATLNSNFNCIPSINRANLISPYFTTSDDRLVEYKFEDILLDTYSPYQHIQILKTVDYGNMLILDGAINLAEHDTAAYTHFIMDLKREKENYGGSNILILGGGDGGILNELLKLDNPPANVTMIELDEEVLKAASCHLRSICGPFLDEDNRVGPNHTVIVADAIATMEQFLMNGDQFDYIFGDLTDLPVDAQGISDNEVNLWSFLKKVLELGIRLVKPITGKYLTHCNGKGATDAIQKYNHILDGLRIPASEEFPTGLDCIYTMTESFVPSFMEVWTFYQLAMVASNK